jgi:ABC-type lipoprotein release transport system permease subunit
VHPLDAATFIAAALILAAVALLASWMPARRAVSIDPALTLRQE